MAKQLKSIKLWGTGGTNPPKVVMILEELGIPYDAEVVMLKDRAYVYDASVIVHACL